MGHEVTIGGERLGSGKRMKAYLKNYERSNHDLSNVVRTTMAPGTLVPVMTEIALPGDTFDINIELDALTHPTIGPLFGSYKIEVHTFQIPIRLYNSKLHMNLLGVGMDMSKVAFPQIELTAEPLTITKPIDNQQINPSCILSYLGIRGLAGKKGATTSKVVRQFNAIPLLGYWDIYKNYYANKQEEIGVVIHQDPGLPDVTLTSGTLRNTTPNDYALTISTLPVADQLIVFSDGSTPSSIEIVGTGMSEEVKPEYFRFWVEREGEVTIMNGAELFNYWTLDIANNMYIGVGPTQLLLKMKNFFYATGNAPELDAEPELVTFPLSNIDEMRETILSYNDDDPFVIFGEDPAPYGYLDMFSGSGTSAINSKRFAQEGLGIKTYNSDLFNNWIDTEWIDGVDGISAVTAVSTVGDSFTIDELNLSRKIYDMLNRIAISGGSYDDWLDAVYTHERQRSAENPIYLGGLIKKLVFQEVISNSASEGQPLGTLAGRGRLAPNYEKGGQVIAKIDEPSYIMSICSITPYVDYSQGNKWDMSLKTMNDLHKPALDEIGFQDLITDQMAWWDTLTDASDVLIYKSAGKQPAWINYMTNVNRVLGNFADRNQQMFMTLNRRYDVLISGGNPTIKDLTTYIDPTKFNHIFADTRRDAQNFWVQVAFNIEARRKMSAKVMPNL